LWKAKKASVVNIVKLISYVFDNAEFPLRDFGSEKVCLMNKFTN